MISEKYVDQKRYMRWKARTDLVWLCQEILGYNEKTYGKDHGVSNQIHDPFISKLQKFRKPTKEQFKLNDEFNQKTGKWEYAPIVPMYDLIGKRKVLILDPRGGLKTTVNATAHTIQWILNYPDIAMLIMQSTGDKAEQIMRGIKLHFQFNEDFRNLFPELCPATKVDDWGTKSAFTTPGRSKMCVSNEETVLASAIGKSLAGHHFDVMKFSDIVDEQNVSDIEREKVIYAFGMCRNLTSRPDSWIDVEGTRYHFGDLYGQIIDEELKKDKKDREWNIHIRGCYLLGTPNAAQFSIDELGLPDKIDEFGNQISWWPGRFPVHTDPNNPSKQSLKSMEKDLVTGPSFPLQMRNDPSKAIGIIPFPIGDGLPSWIPRKTFEEQVRVSNYEVIVDLAETTNARSDFTCITVGAWDDAGRPYIVDMRHGKFSPDEILRKIIFLYELYKADCVKIEEDNYNRGIMFGFNRILDMENRYINFVFLKRDTKIRKTERILNTLQPWYIGKPISGKPNIFSLRFVEPLSTEFDKYNIDHEDNVRLKNHLLNELSKFPKYNWDDMLDTIADMFQGKDYFGRLRARADQKGKPAAQDIVEKIISEHWDNLLGLDDIDKATGSGTKKRLLLGNQVGSSVDPSSQYYSRTGIL